MGNTQYDITADLITALLREQHPDLAELPLRLGARGWDNQMWQLGSDLAVRLPWSTNPSSGERLLKEHAILPAMASRLPLPIPVPQRLGRASALFPRPWIVTTWITGEPADRAPATRQQAADSLACFLAALHQPALDDAASGRHGRGGRLASISKDIAQLLEEATNRGLIPDQHSQQRALRRLWNDALAAPDWTGPSLWLHADLHPANLLTRDGNFCGVVDFGDMCAGDPACDLAAAWILLPDGLIDRFYHAYAPKIDIDAATRRRACGWALCKALVCLIIGDDGIHGRPGGKTTWGPPAKASLQRLIAKAL